jgi:quercetin dioxygenase-like cupin family protein
MTKRRLTIALSAAMTVLAGAWGVQRASAQMPAGFKRVELQHHDISAAGREAVLARGEFQPGATVPKHTHPGEEVGFVVQGELQVEIEGKPAMTVKAGDSFFIPAGTVHGAKNVGKTAAAVVSTYIVEKGKPLATPVGAPAAPTK